LIRVRRSAVIAPLYSMFTASFSFAQAPAEEPPPKLEATAQASALAATGNASAQSLGFAGDIITRPGLWIHTGRATFAQTRDEDGRAALSIATLFRSGRTLSPRLSAFGQYDFLRDLFAGIEQRHTIASGLSYLAINGAAHKLRLDGGLGYQHESRLDAEDTNSAVLLGGLVYRWKISMNGELVEEFHATLPVQRTDEWKIEQGASITATISSLFSLKVSSIVRFVNAPVPGFEKTDTTTSFALVMKIRRPA
jgi:putative salt-induced outer membrane protein YdiY